MYGPSPSSCHIPLNRPYSIVHKGRFLLKAGRNHLVLVASIAANLVVESNVHEITDTGGIGSKVTLGVLTVKGTKTRMMRLVYVLSAKVRADTRKGGNSGTHR